MQTRQLGDMDLQITTIGLGTWALGGAGWLASWGAQDDNDSLATIHKALDLGINWIDTAAVYGLGHSEEIIGRALKGRANRPYIFTKCGRRGTADGKIESVLKADSTGDRGEPAPPAGRRHRSLPDALAAAGRGSRRRLAHDGRTEGSRRTIFRLSAEELQEIDAFTQTHP
jgi:aryl-alcohol dehydrogenase-like predicted oxidoreductase